MNNNIGIPSLTITEKRPTKAACIEDLLKISEEFPENIITRDFYRNHASIKEKDWIYYFGKFPEFLKSAGLKETRYQNNILNKTALHSSVDELKILSADLKTYGNRYIRDKGKGNYRTVMIISDLHDEKMDPFTERVWYSTVKMVQPDVVVFGGDLFDNPEFSKFDVDPREWDVVSKIKKGLDIVKNTREIIPNTQIDLIGGNHESRILKHLNSASPAMRALLSDFHDMNIAKLLRLDEYHVNYISQHDLGTFTKAEEQNELQKNYKIYYDSLLVHHFPQGGDLGIPCVYGHHHKHIVIPKYNVTYGSYEVHQLGCGHKKNASYTDASLWMNGFMIANINITKKRTIFDYVDVGDTHCIAGGTWYYRKPEEYYAAIQ